MATAEEQGQRQHRRKHPQIKKRRRHPYDAAGTPPHQFSITQTTYEQEPQRLLSVIASTPYSRIEFASLAHPPTNYREPHNWTKQEQMDVTSPEHNHQRDQQEQDQFSAEGTPYPPYSICITCPNHSPNSALPSRELQTLTKNSCIGVAVTSRTH